MGAYRHAKINVTNYGAGYDAGYTAALVAKSQTVTLSPERVAVYGEDYTKGYSAGVAQYSKDCE